LDSIVLVEGQSRRS